MNLFARSLGIPLDIHGAAAALAAGTLANVDIGEVNGRFFVHHVTLGLHPRMIRIRERLHYGSRLGKIWATIQAWWVVVRRPPLLAARIHPDEASLDVRTASILVTNNPLGEGHLPYADDLRQGELGLYIATSRRWHDLLQLAAQMALGEIAATPLLESRRARAIRIEIAPDVANASVDGEIVSLAVPLRLRVRRRGLTVLRPQPSPGADSTHRLKGELASPPGVGNSTRSEGSAMAEELNRTEARQGDRRRTNVTALTIGIIGAVVLMGVILLIWA
jgi:diacylglycerol kinase family enzyme